MELFLQVESFGQRFPPVRLQCGVSLVVGRHPDCDLVLPDPHTSRRQLTIELDEGGCCRVRDLGSKNPMKVNEQVVGDVILNPGDLIEIGQTKIQLRQGSVEGGGTSAVSVVAGLATRTLERRVTLQADGQINVFSGGEDGDRGRRKLDSFYRLAETLAEAPDPDTFFDRVLDILFLALPAQRGFVGLGSPEHGTFQAVKVRSDRSHESSTIEMSQTILDEIQLERKALLVQDAPGELAYSGAQSIIRLGIRSFMCAPMFVGNDYVGLLYLDQVATNAQFGEEDLAFLQGVARLSGLAIDNLRFRERLRTENESLRAILGRRNQLIAKSPKMLEVLRRIQRLGERDSSILITGETGTGKELAARAIHDSSSRREGPFVAFNCSLLNPSMIESELFGHVKGAFTDASRDHKGKFELATGGTLFLDEIGDMPLETQVKILRAIQEKRVEPVGGERSINVDIRLISATHRDLTEMRQQKLFRDDLFYRIAVLTLDLPPLRDRGEDVLAIAGALLPEGMEIEPAAQKALQAYEWPGNVRELQNVMEQASFNCSGRRIRLQDLPEEVAREGRKARLEVPLATISEVEAKHIRKVLKACDGNKKRSAELLGISRETLYQKLKLYQIS
ncbi:MAG: sigma 54-interacting transcriptional regulator [Planctomycetota bacterium]